jgi:hypothetical protein
MLIIGRRPEIVKGNYTYRVLCIEESEKIRGDVKSPVLILVNYNVTV